MQSISSSLEIQPKDFKEDGELTDYSTEMEDGEVTDSSNDPKENDIAEYNHVSKIPKRKVITHFIDGKKIKSLFDFYVIIDFEGTCGVLKNSRHRPIKGGIQEIIEFPAVLLNCHNGLIVDEFQSFCQPVLNPSLTQFCKKLTGITQDDVDKAPLFKDVFALFEEWLQKHQLIGSTYSFAVVTDGPNDIDHFLKNQCKVMINYYVRLHRLIISKIDFPTYCKKWINIKKTFARFYKNGNTQCLSLKNMIRDIGCDFQGRNHSGIDDARNIAVIVQRLLKDGARVLINENLAFARKNKTKFKSVAKSASTQAKPVEIKNSKNMSSAKMITSKNNASKKAIPAPQNLTTGVHDEISVKKRRHRNAKRQIKNTQVVPAKNFKTADNPKNTELIAKKLKLAERKVRNLKKKLKSSTI